MNKDNNNRREHERFTFREDIIVEGIRLCTSMDISEGGLYVSAIQSFDINSIIDVTIPFKGEKISLKAKVQYSQPGIGMGIMFIDLDDEQKTIIRELIENIAK